MSNAEPLKDHRHEAFVLLLLEGRGQSEAFRQIYPRSRHWKASAVHEQASKLAAKVSPRLRALQEQAAHEAVLSVIQRKVLLSKIATEVGEVDPADHLEAGGDGVYINFGKESKNRGAVAGLKSRTDMSGEGGQPGAVITEIRYRPFSDAVAAIAELNKMEGVGQAKQPDQTAPVVFNVIFPSGPRVPAPKIRTITMEDAKAAARNRSER